MLVEFCAVCKTQCQRKNSVELRVESSDLTH